eukprot:g2238.t1
MVSTRLTELWMPDVAPSLKQLTEAQESGSALFPVDFMTDCRDFFELTTGAKAVPQDKQQRLYVLAYKEARVSGRARYVMLIPTASMLADCLTKPMLAPQMMQFLSSGFVEVWNELKHFIQLRRLPVLQELTEADLYKSDEEIKKQIHNGAQKVTMTMVAGFATKPWKWMMMAAMVSSSLPLAVRRHVLSAARAYLTERRRNAASSAQPRETRPVELQQALQETLEASRRTSKAMRFIKHLKENSIEQKLLAMQQRVNCEDDTPGGSDQMLEEACHLAAQLHELSSVQEGGVSKALLEELQSDIAAMRQAIQSIQIDDGNVCPIEQRRAEPSVDDLAASKRGDFSTTTSIDAEKNGREGDATMFSEEAAVLGARSGFSGRERPPQARQGRAAHGAHTDVHRPAGAANRATTAAVEWQELLSERATEWMAQADADNPAADRGSASEMHWPTEGVKGGEVTGGSPGGSRDRRERDDGNEEEEDERDGGDARDEGDEDDRSAQHCSEDGADGTADHLDHGHHGCFDSAHGRSSQLSDDALHGTFSSDGRDGDGRDGRVLPRLLHSAVDKFSSPHASATAAAHAVATAKAVGGEDSPPALDSPFFPRAEEPSGRTPDSASEHHLTHAAPAAERVEAVKSLDLPRAASSGESYDPELLQTLDLPVFLKDCGLSRCRRGVYLGHWGHDGSGGTPGESEGNASSCDEWNLESLDMEEWQLMAACLHYPGAVELRQRLLEPIGLWPSHASRGAVPAALARRNSSSGRSGEESGASESLGGALRRKRRLTLPYILWRQDD